MFRFKVFENAAPARSFQLEGAHLLGAEHVPIRAEIRFDKGEIICEPRTRGAAALALMWPVRGRGRMMLETLRVQERKEPYNLHVELARGQLMRISLKREDWGLYDYPDGGDVLQQVQSARDLLLDAMTALNDETAAARGDEAVAGAVQAGEAVGALHADIFIKRRRPAAPFGRYPTGCRLSIPECFDKERNRAGSAGTSSGVDSLDFLTIPMSWSQVEPREGRLALDPIERWLRVAHEHKRAVFGGGLVSFDALSMPRWLRGSAREYDRVREPAQRYVRQIVKGLAGHVHGWEVVRGLHARNPLKLSFDQLIDLTRTCALAAKQSAPKSTVLVGLVVPWGEYYARDTQTIPPMLYAEMCIQGGIPFDAFGLELRFSGGEGGSYIRDLMQISALLDRFGNLGKPIHVTAAGVPADGAGRFGQWRGAWDEERQAQWLSAFFRVAFSKPFVETVAWNGLTDCPDDPEHGGLLRADGTAKAALEEIRGFERAATSASAR